MAPRGLPRVRGWKPEVEAQGPGPARSLAPLSTAVCVGTVFTFAEGLPRGTARVGLVMGALTDPGGGTGDS